MTAKVRKYPAMGPDRWEMADPTLSCATDGTLIPTS
jgi:hypothetical protein